MDTNEAYIKTAGGSSLRVDTTADEVRLVNGETLDVDEGTLYVNAQTDQVSVRTRTATHAFEVIGDGRFSTDLTVSGSDVYIGDNDAVNDVIHFAGDTEQILWTEGPDEFAVTDDVSIAGDLSVWGSTRLGDSRRILLS